MLLPQENEQPSTAAETPEDKLVAQVTDKASTSSYEDAYSSLKTGVESLFADKSLAEKKASWTAISDKLTANGVLPKLSASFLEEMHGQADTNKDGKLQKSELTPVANAKNPFYQGMATQALKDFDTAASLHDNDGAINRLEVVSFKRRQYMPAREEFVSSLLKNIADKLDSPREAVTALHSGLSLRTGMETPTERHETWQAVADELSKQKLVPKLSMAFLNQFKQHFDADKDNAVSRSEIQRFTGSPSPIMKTFSQYLNDKFDDIATIDYQLDRISSKEQETYERKMFSQK